MKRFFRALLLVVFGVGIALGGQALSRRPDVHEFSLSASEAFDSLCGAFHRLVWERGPGRGEHAVAACNTLPTVELSVVPYEPASGAESCCSPAACHASLRCRPQCAMSTADHLSAAADHLEAAGLKDQADQLRHEAALESKRQLLAEKLSELKTLQAEVDRLLHEATDLERPAEAKPVQPCEESPAQPPEPKAGQPAAQGQEHASEQTSQPKLILGRFWLFEVDRSKLGELAGVFGDEPSGKPGPTATPLDESALNLIDGMKQTGAVKEIAAPTVPTLSGRAATFEAGRAIPLLTTRDGKRFVEVRKVGNTLEFLPILLGDGRVRSEVRLTTVDLAGQMDGVPQSRSRYTDTALDLEPGKTYLVHALRHLAAGSKCEAAACACQAPAAVEGQPATTPEESAAEAENQATQNDQPSAAHPAEDCTELIVLVRCDIAESTEPGWSPRPFPAVRAMPHALLEALKASGAEK